MKKVCLQANLLLYLETAEPGFQFEHHFEVVGERLADAKTVSARRIDVHGGRNAVRIELLIVVEAVDGRNGFVVVGQSQETAWGLFGNMLFVAVFVDQLLLGAFA